MMAKSGQQHSKADVGGQRPPKDDKKGKSDEKSADGKGDQSSDKTGARTSGKKM